MRGGIIAGSSRNLRLADWIYAYLCAAGPKSVAEIKDYINHENLTKPTSGNPIRKTKHSYSSQQITGVVRTNPLFRAVNQETDTYEKFKAGWVYRWEAKPIEDVVDDMLTNAVSITQHRLRRFQPNVIKTEFRRRGFEI